jgi:acyl carrier protein
MATKTQIQTRVLAFFRAKWNFVTTTTVMSDDLLLDDRQVLDTGTHLAIELGCDPSRGQILKCKTVGDLITLLQNTRFTADLKNIQSFAKAQGGKP